jgi:hypothetical protein
LVLQVLVAAIVLNSVTHVWLMIFLSNLPIMLTTKGKTCSMRGTVRREGLVSFARITPELLISYDLLVLLS